MKRFYYLLPAFAFAALAAGCGGDDAIIGSQIPNTPPETQVTGTPPTLTETGYQVRFFWTGSDPDGRVTGYEWRISDNGPDGVIDVADTLGLPWNFTTVTDSTFIVTADMSEFPKDVENPRLGPANWRFWQTHTFFVRAVDDKEERDPTPANVSFTATTLTPFIVRTLPAGDPGVSCGSGPLALAFGWEGVDPDNPTGEPEAIRYKLIPWNRSTCLTRNEFASSTIVQDSENIPWSRWIRYDAPLDSGKIVRFSPQGVNPGDTFIFVVQARDVAGAVTPAFTWGSNVWHVRTSASWFPELEVSERFLGGKAYRAIGGIERFSIVSKQPLEFTWSATAEAYGGLIEGYKYGFNVADPNDPNDEGWFVDWGIGTNWQRSLPRTFSQGSPNFVAQVRDNSGTISRALYQFQVIQIAQRSEQEDLLFVDDWVDGGQGAANDREYDEAWKSLLSGVQGFQFENHSVDAEKESGRLTFALANEYKSVVWFTSSNAASFLQTRLAPQSPTVIRFNWLEIYQRFVGNVLMVGPGSMWRSLEPTNFEFPIIFNVSSGGRQGMGTRRLPDGTVVNRGTERYPYTAWCLEAIDMIEPGQTGDINGETSGTRRLRSNRCDALTYARVAPDFVVRFGVTPAQVANLIPTTPRLERTDVTPRLLLNFEEFYNVNVTGRDVSLNVRSCQVPMFQHIARSDIDELAIMDPSQLDPKRLVSEADSLFFSANENAGYRLAAQPRVVSLINDPRDTDPSDGIDQIKDCGWAVVQRRKSSHVTGKTAALASRAFVESGTKQDGQVTTEDFLLGFNPLGFQQGQVRIAVGWIVETLWGLNRD